MMPAWNFEAGEILLFDKPFDWSSFDLVQKVKNTIKKHTGHKVKVGHAGTLDPYATGLLILCTGKSTKKIESIQDLPKTYSGLIQLGATTASYDLESEPEHFFTVDHVTDAMIAEKVAGFMGEQDQLPPIFSAKMINGTRAYELARKGEVPVMNPKKIEIFEFKVQRLAKDELEFTVKCSKGTYIRSLAHDLGQALGCGGYLAKLSRDAIGDYTLAHAYTIEGFEQSLAG
jgi:tRNA pseudouridine55 synthase